MSKFEDLTGQRFGMLYVIERCNDYISPSGRHTVRWKCKCDCGNIKEITACHLKSGEYVSCGCYHMKRFLASGVDYRFKKKHGMCQTRIYREYRNMKYRCSNPNSPGYHNYGGRGIKVCSEWLGENGFENFYNWSINNGYDDKLTLDRIDVNGDYEPSNCRWVDWETQYNNTTKSVKLTYNGRTMTATQWARELGVDRHTIYDRIRNGWSVERIVTTGKSKGS